MVLAIQHAYRDKRETYDKMLENQMTREFLQQTDKIVGNLSAHYYIIYSSNGQLGDENILRAYGWLPLMADWITIGLVCMAVIIAMCWGMWRWFGLGPGHVWP